MSGLEVAGLVALVALAVGTWYYLTKDAAGKGLDATEEITDALGGGEEGGEGEGDGGEEGEGEERN